MHRNITGYRTHMMVFGPGGYRFADFLQVGIPLNLLTRIAAVILIPLIGPFHASGPWPQGSPAAIGVDGMRPLDMTI